MLCLTNTVAMYSGLTLLSIPLIIRIRLEVIDSALMLEDIRLPGYDLHELKGDRQGTWSIKVSGNWRITFSFEDGEVYDVNLEDYH